MTQTNTNKGLKASKVKAATPSKAETILADSVKLTLAPVVGEATKAFDLFAKQQDASVAYDTAEQTLADDLYQYLFDTKPDYANWQAIKKHIITSIATAKGRKFDTIEKWFNAKIVKAIKELGFVLPKAESKASQGMAKLRAELASIETEVLQDLIEASAKAGDFKKASQLATEKQKREKAELRAVEKAESKHTRELKSALKNWIGKMPVEQLAALVWAKNNFAQITKLAKSSK